LPANTVNSKTLPINTGYVDHKKVRKIYKKRIYYSFLTVVLIICLFQVGRGAYLNVAKYFVLNSQLGKLKEINLKSKEQNKHLKEELHNYNSTKGVEEIARNKLNLAGADEVLVIIKEPEKTIEQGQDKNKKPD